jgi:hypothetical protein
MIEVIREREWLNSIPVFDALNFPGVLRAWCSVGSVENPEIQPVLKPRAFVSLCFLGCPPEDTEIIRLSKMDPSLPGLIRVPYLDSFDGMRFSMRSFPVRDLRARWGLLALQFSDEP